MAQEKKFKINMTREALQSFIFASYYSRLGGIFSILLGVGGVAMAVREIFFREKTDITGLAVYVIIAIFCLLVNPLLLRSQAKKQLETSPSYQQPIEYTLYPEYLEVCQGEEHLEVGWELIYKIKLTGKMVAIQTGKMNAFVWPLSELGDEKASILSRVVQYTQEFRPILSGNLKEYRRSEG
jgi:hypothetical protein